MRTDEPGRLAPRATVAVVAYFATSAAAMAVVRGRMWSLAAYHEDPIDIAWRLQLAWRALRGEWSLFDFQYPRGPLWQLAAASASLLGGQQPGWTLAVLHLLLQWSSLAFVVWLMFRAVRPGWGRALAVLGAALLTDASGIATFRAFLPLLVVVAHVWPSERPWRQAFVSAAITVVSGLVSLDRLPLCAIAAVSASLVELAIARRRGDRLAPAGRRLARYGLALGGLLASLAAALALAGVDLEAAARGQLAIGAAYAGGMSAAWRVAVVREHVAIFYGGCLAVGAWGVWRSESAEPRRAVVWLLACAPGAAFALVRTDPGHVALAMAPLVVGLIAIAMGHGPERRQRWLAGGLAVAATLLWFVKHPDNVAGHPRVLRRVAQLARSERAPVRGFQSDLSAAVEWVGGAPGCVGVSADLSGLHALADVDGPTVLALRWDDELRRALADRIAERDCPRFVYSVRNYPTPGTSWPFGDDFLEVARRYRVEDRLGVATLGMVRRERPLRVSSRSLAAPSEHRVDVPGELRIALREPVLGTDLVEVDLTMQMAPWRAWAGGSPLVEWRFERDGAPVSGWRWAWPAVAGRRARVFIAPDTESAEWHWMGQPTADRSRSADTLALRVLARGLATPSSLQATVHGVRRWRRPPPEPRPNPLCVSELDLMESLRGGSAFVRYAAPQPEPDRFTLRPRADGERLAEVLFEVVPCEDSCVSASFALQASDVSDGAEVEVHALELPARSRLFWAALPTGGERVSFEASLDPWAGRTTLLRFGALRVDSWWYDNVKVIEPRVGRCTARRSLALGDIPPGVVVQGSDLRWAERATYALDVTVVEATCLRLGAEGRGWLEVRVRDEGAEHVIVDRRIRGAMPTGEWSLHDFVGRRVTLMVSAPGLTLRAPELARCGAAR